MNPQIDVKEEVKAEINDGETSSQEKKEVVSDEDILAAQKALEHLKKLKKQTLTWDPNLPNEVEQELDEAFETDDLHEKIQIAEELLENSPYPEVRAAVLNYDSGGHSSTIRAWVLGLLFAMIGSGCNALLSMRNPYIVISSYVAQVVVYPIGCAWAKWLPEGRFSFFGHECFLNPGPFSKKEHAITVIMANATFAGGAAYAVDIIIAQRAFYHQSFGRAFELMLTISNMMLGFGFAGMFHKILVEPAAMIWPGNLINTALFTALHDHPAPDPTKTFGWSINKYRFFTYVMIASFIWFWFPGYIAPFLSYFAFVTWIKPNNVIINQLFGQSTGISLIPITFDWAQISGFNFSPLIAPWHAIGNTLIGLIVFVWILTPILHYSNYGYGKYLPISDSGAYDNTANSYNVSMILDPSTHQFVEEKYQAYSPIFLSTTFSLTYGLSFASIAAVVVHTALFHGKDFWKRMKNLGEVDEDIHARLMAKYKPVPMWWYLIVLAITFGMGMGVSVGWETHLTWYSFIFCIAIGWIYFVPIGVIAATTNIWIGLNVFTEFIIGYMQPGRPLAMMLFKSYGYMAMNQGLGFTSDMKMGHYLKLPPRVTYAAQIVATILSAFTQVGVVNWALTNIDQVCTRHQKDHFSCPNAKVFFNASVIWGAIGPRRIFSPGAIYAHLLIFFIPGTILPIIFYLAARRWPKSSIRFLNAPVIFSGIGLLPPATPLNYLSWGLVGFIFNKWIRNRWRGWWMQYNYILSAGLDVGLALSTIFIFCALQLNDVNFPTWWGNGASQNTMDLQGTAIQVTLPDGQKFGPATWS